MRQYIGARYVPKFFENSATGDSTWAANTTYEGLTIVTWNGNTYISKKSVPASVGNPAENSNYWVVSGTTTVSALISRMDSLEDDFEDLEGDVNDLASDVATDIASVSTKLGKKVSKFNDRRFIILGDSYDNIVSNLKWSDIVIDKLGLLNSIVLCVGGYSFSNSSEKYWNDLLAGTVIANPETITDILIVGGANDSWTSGATVRQAMNTFNTTVRTRFANLDSVWLGFAANSYLNDNQHHQFTEMARVYNDQAKALGWKYLNNIETTLFNPQYLQSLSGGEDMLHPNYDGVNAIGRNVVECMLTGYCQNRHSTQLITFSKNNEVFNSGNFQIQQIINNDKCTIIMNDTSFVNPSELAAGNAIFATCEPLSCAANELYIPFNFTVNNVLKNAILRILNFTQIQVIFNEAIPANSASYIRGFSYTLDLSW